MRALAAQVSLLALLLVIPTAGAAAQDGFSHPAHAGLFPLCEGCHPVSAEGRVDYPAPTTCGTCHDGAELSRVTWSAPSPQETLDHRFHASTPRGEPACGACHAGNDPVRAAAAEESCKGCHARHHEAGDVRCRACHGTASVPEHTTDAHRGCAGSGCHDAARIRVAEWDRELCLVCHQGMVEHRPGRACGPCHAVASPGQ